MKSKDRIVTILISALVAVLFSSVSAYAAASYLYNADEVSYDKTNSELTSTDVQGAIDELYNKATEYTNLQNKVGTATLNTSAQNLSAAVNELNSNSLKAIQIQIAFTTSEYIYVADNTNVDIFNKYNLKTSTKTDGLHNNVTLASEFGDKTIVAVKCLWLGGGTAIARDEIVWPDQTYTLNARGIGPAANITGVRLLVIYK